MDADVVLAALIASKTPVIISAPPAHNSQLSKGKRMYCNLTVDYLGPNQLPNLSATRVKKTKGKSAPPIDIDKEESGTNDSNSVEEVPKNHCPKSTAASEMKPISVYPHSRPFRLAKTATTSQVLVLSDSLTPEPKSSKNDYRPDQESRDINTDVDMEGDEVASEKSTAEDIDSEYEQELLLRKHKVNESQVSDSKQKGNVPSLDSKAQVSKHSKTVAFNVPKPCTIRPKAGCRIPSSPTYVSSGDDVGKVERPVQKSTRSNAPGSCEESANAVKVVVPLNTSDTVHRTVTPGSMQKTGPDTDISNLRQAPAKTPITPVPLVSTQPDAHKESTHSAKTLISTQTPDPTTVASINIHKHKPALPVVPIGTSSTCIFADSNVPGTAMRTPGFVSTDLHHGAAPIPTTSEYIFSLDSSTARPTHGPSDKQDGGKCCQFHYMHL